MASMRAQTQICIDINAGLAKVMHFKNTFAGNGENLLLLLLLLLLQRQQQHIRLLNTAPIHIMVSVNLVRAQVFFGFCLKLICRNHKMLILKYF